MVTKVTEGKQALNIVVPGAEAEYVAIMNALVIGISSINEDTPRHIDARKTLSELLIAMLPEEDTFVIPCLKTA